MKTISGFGKTCSVCGEELARFGGDWFGFWVGLGQSLTVLNIKHVGLGFLRF